MESKSVFDEVKLNQQLDKLRFAEEMAIGFSKWVSFSPDIYINVEKEDYFYTVDKKRYAPKELYQLYLQSKIDMK
jgi:hypothetical protein